MGGGAIGPCPHHSRPSAAACAQVGPAHLGTTGRNAGVRAARAGERRAGLGVVHRRGNQGAQGGVRREGGGRHGERARQAHRRRPAPGRRRQPPGAARRAERRPRRRALGRARCDGRLLRGGERVRVGLGNDAQEVGHRAGGAPQTLHAQRVGVLLRVAHARGGGGAARSRGGGRQVQQLDSPPGHGALRQAPRSGQLRGVEGQRRGAAQTPRSAEPPSVESSGIRTPQRRARRTQPAAHEDGHASHARQGLLAMLLRVAHALREPGKAAAPRLGEEGGGGSGGPADEQNAAGHTAHHAAGARARLDAV